MNKTEYIIEDDRIVFSDTFNNRIENYKYITSEKSILYFGESFNQELYNIPENVKQIILGKKFNRSLEMLPETIESIIFVPESEYYYPLNHINNNIKELVLPDNYDTKINKFPYNLNRLILPKNYIYEVDEFPPNLKYLCPFANSLQLNMISSFADRLPFFLE